MPNITAYVIVHSEGHTVVASWRDATTGEPSTHLNKKTAVIAMVKNFADELNDQADQVKTGDREPDDIDVESYEWVEEVTISEDGTMTIVSDGTILYDPKIKQS